LEIKIPYRGTYLEVNVPLPKENIRVLKSKDPSPTKDVEEIIRIALAKPIGKNRLSEIVRSGDKVSLMFDDWTRPTPVSKIVPIVLEELKNGGIRDEDIVLICGNGMHAPDYMAEERLIQKLGKAVFCKYKVVSHNAYDHEKLKFMGVTKSLGTPLFINKYVAVSDVKVSIGRIAPHGDVGYSGGSKMIMPGVASIWTIIHNHSGSFPHSGILGNSLRKDIDDCGRMASLDFIVNVVYNSDEEVVQAFAGDPFEAHYKGVEFGDKEVWGSKIADTAEIVITSPGLKKDGFFLSSMKCLEVADRCLKEGGTIIVVASCMGGWSEEVYLESGWRVTKDILEYGYPELLRLLTSRVWHEPHRQFQALVYYAQHIVKTCIDKHVVLAGSKGFSKEDAQKININFEESIDDALRSAIKKYGPRAKMIVVPDSFTLPLKRFYRAK